MQRPHDVGDVPSERDAGFALERLGGHGPEQLSSVDRRRRLRVPADQDAAQERLCVGGVEACPARPGGPARVGRDGA
ncbi:MAG: hypothetical protein AB1689_02960, partial [Thermodesulfobacteriota bacterium]